jgi:hypothetical protein
MSCVGIKGFDKHEKYIVMDERHCIIFKQQTMRDEATMAHRCWECRQRTQLHHRQNQTRSARVYSALPRISSVVFSHLSNWLIKFCFAGPLEAAKCAQLYKYLSYFLFTAENIIFIKVFERYHPARLDLHESGSIGLALNRTSTAIGFRFYNFTLEYLNRLQSSEPPACLDPVCIDSCLPTGWYTFI